MRSSLIFLGLLDVKLNGSATGHRVGNGVECSVKGPVLVRRENGVATPVGVLEMGIGQTAGSGETGK
jgi:hypothetical protein